jgi:hypothetical protein
MVSSVLTNVSCDLRRAPGAGTRIMCLAVLGLHTAVVVISTFVEVLCTIQACLWVPGGGAIAAGHSLCPKFVCCRCQSCSTPGVEHLLFVQLQVASGFFMLSSCCSAINAVVEFGCCRLRRS